MPDQLPLFGPTAEADLTDLTDPSQSVGFYTDSSLEEVLDRAAREARDIMERQWRARQLPVLADGPPSIPVDVLAPLPPAPADQVLDTLDEVIGALKTGREISGLRERIAQLVTNQESRAELISNMAMTHDFDRLAKHMRARASLEDILLTAATDRTLTPTQALAFLKLTQEQCDTILSRVRAGATNIQDLITLLNKADYALQLQDSKLSSKFSNTTPQGREIIRRLAHRLNKVAAAEATRVED